MSSLKLLAAAVMLKLLFSHFFVVSQRFYEGFKVFINPFEAPQRSVKIKI